MLARMIILSLSIASLVGCSSPPSTPSAISSSTESSVKTALKPIEKSDPVGQTTPDRAEPVAETRIAPRSSEPTIEQQKASASLKQSQQEYELLTQSMTGRQKIISDLTAQVNKLDAELSEFNNQVNLYMFDNKTEVACMSALGMSLDKDNQYSKGAKDLAAATTIACGIGMVSDGKFTSNVAKVFNQLVRANNQSNSLKQQLSDARSKLSQETDTYETEKARASTLSNDIKR